MSARANFVVIGTPKAGTTWVHDFFDLNPSFFVPTAKDTYFFDRHFDRGSKWYERHFSSAPSRALAGEVCHDYMYSTEALERIADYFDDTLRVILLLREPTSRSVSHLKYSYQVGTVDTLDTRALQQNPNIIQLSRYEEYLDDIVALLGDRLHILFFEQLQESEKAFGQTLATSCGLPGPLPQFSFPGRSNAAAKPRSRALTRSAKKAALLLDRFGARGVVGRLKSSPLRDVVFQAGAGAEVDAATLLQIDHELEDSRREIVRVLERLPHLRTPIPSGWLKGLALDHRAART